MDDNELLKCNDRGLIPGPEETIDQFEKRVDFCTSLKQEAFEAVRPKDAWIFEEEIEKRVLKPAFSITQKKFAIIPDWVPLFFSNHQLAPWHGGAAWIFQLREDSPKGALLQLRKHFFKHSNYFGLYSRDELIAHELAHVGRMAYQEEEYEELLAYRSSVRDFASSFGPLIGSAFESRLFVMVLMSILLMDLFFVIQGSWDGYEKAFPFKLLPFLLILWAWVRLRRKRGNLEKTSKKLGEIFPNKAEAVLYRLTDKEINDFSNWTLEEIKGYMGEEPSLRWRVIRLMVK